MKRRKGKKRSFLFEQSCYRCEHCEYIGEGDSICTKYEEDPERAIVLEDWEPTENYMQCKRKESKQ